MKAYVSDDCISCGICPDVCPEVFQFGDDGLAHPIVDEVPPEVEDKARQACEECPVDAITLEE